MNSDDVVVLAELLSQESYRRCINSRSGWGIPVTPLRTAAAHGHLRCLELLLEHGAEVRCGDRVLWTSFSYPDAYSWFNLQSALLELRLIQTTAIYSMLLYTHVVTAADVKMALDINVI